MVFGLYFCFVFQAFVRDFNRPNLDLRVYDEIV